VVGQIEINIEAPQTSRLAIPDRIDLVVGKYLPARGLLDVRERPKSRRQQAAFGNGVGSHLCQHIPGHALRKLDAHPALNSFSFARHEDARHRPVGEVIARLQHFRLASHDGQLLRFVGSAHDGERLRRQRPVAGIRRQRVRKSGPRQGEKTYGASRS